MTRPWPCPGCGTVLGAERGGKAAPVLALARWALLAVLPDPDGYVLVCLCGATRAWRGRIEG